MRVDPADKRSRRLVLTDAGRAKLAEALPLWRSTHVAVERNLGRASPDRLRRSLRALA